MLQHQEDVHHTEGNGRDREEVNRSDLADVVGQESPPVLGRRLGLLGHVLVDRGLGHVVAQQKQLGQNPRGTPSRILPAHAAKQVADRPVRLGSAGLPAGLPSPVELEALAMPARHGVGLADEQGRLPTKPQPRKPVQQDPVRLADLGAWNGSLHDDQLLPEHHVLGGQIGPAGKKRPHEAQDRQQDAHLHASVFAHKAGILRRRPAPGNSCNSFMFNEDGVFGRDRV